MNASLEPFMHWCEVCGIEELLTSEEAFRAGWDFPPRSGPWGVVSPRTCGKCPMTATVWWAVTLDGYDQAQLSTQQCEGDCRTDRLQLGCQAARATVGFMMVSYSMGVNRLRRACRRRRW